MMSSVNKLKKLKTLLVDDDEFIRDSLKIAFATKGFSMRVAETAEKGLQAIKEEQFDIIICDFRLPGINGLDFIKQAAVTHTDAVKILMIAYRDERVVSAAVRMGVTEFIEKPFSVKALFSVLAFALERKAKQPAIVIN